MADEKNPMTDSVNGFNTFSVEIRTRIETLTKQVLVVSGGIQTITISAFLTGTQPKLDQATIALLKCGWLQLSASIILCLIFMLFQIFGLIHVGFKHKSLLANPEPGVKIMVTWLPLRVCNWLISLSAFVLCVYGVYTISKAAISLIGMQAGV